jgi:hypothetical protein
VKRSNTREVATRGAFALTAPAQSVGRYADVDWDAVLSQYHGEIAEHRKSKSGKSKSSKSSESKH